MPQLKEASRRSQSRTAPRCPEPVGADPVAQAAIAVVDRAPG